VRYGKPPAKPSVAQLYSCAVPSDLSEGRGGQRVETSVFYSTWYLVPVYSQYSPTDQINGLIPGVGVYQWNLITLYLARQAHLIELDLHFLPII